MWEGRVEIFISGVWGTVDGDGTQFPEAAVVCRQLGYNTRSKVYLIVYHCAYE